ncbi:MAG: hypothetical protein KatS3mg060_2453 [Dehalococcoidia bacterium]|jgi:uncharacterized protein (DUF1684 family)|nr:MAG: hypothetical protein KatS3mg060_2453 [Dehalococcoidia bacterium]
MDDRLALLDWRRQVSALYAEVRAAGAGPAAAARFRAGRDRLFAGHPQSPLSARADFRGLRWYPYDPAFRVVAPVEPAPPGWREVPAGEDGVVRLERFGRVRFVIAGQPVSLDLYWIAGYGGGVFLPFRDATNGTETYGGGRYLLDTIKHADLGSEGEALVLDFNYAYNPSCAYDDRWVCPLAPPENMLAIPVRAGERAFVR